MSRIPADASLPELAGAFAGRRCWISGARGFLGGRLSASLEAAGAALHRFGGDLRDAEAVRASVRAARPEVLFHLGAPVDVSRDEALDPLMRAAIYEGSSAVLEAALAEPGSLLVHVGTCEEYGAIAAPFAETDEPGPPVSPYARWKLAATRELLKRGGDRVVVARPFLTFGPGQRPRQLVPAAVDAALRGRAFPMTSGEQTREWNYLDDTVRGLLRCGLVDAVRGSVVNVGGGEETTVRAMVERIFALCGAAADLVQPGALPRRPGEVPRFCSDATRCREVLGHVGVVSLDEGLRRTIEHARTALEGR